MYSENTHLKLRAPKKNLKDPKKKKKKKKSSQWCREDEAMKEVLLHRQHY